MKTSKYLMISSVIVVIVMCSVIYWTTRVIGQSQGILVSMLFYWFGLCWPLALYFQGWVKLRENLSLSLNGHRYIPIIVLCAVTAAATFTYLTLPENIPYKVFLLAPLFALINGPAEEVYWRGSYLTVAKQSVPIWAAGLLCFTAWHFAFIIPNYMILTNGTFGLIVGAFCAGLFWTWIVWKTGRIGWTVISHILFNACAFIEIIAVNFI